MLHRPIAILEHLGKLVSRVDVQQRIRDVPQNAFFESQISTFESFPMVHGMQMFLKW